MKRVLFLLLIAYVAVAMDGRCTFPTQRVQCGSFSCNRTTNVCDHCKASEDCYEQAMSCEEGYCRLTPLFKRSLWKVILAGGLGCLICAIAVVAGVGGGGILVPLYVIILQIPLRNAVALSQATIAGQSGVNTLMLLGRYHPDFQPPTATRPLINYEYLCLLLPISLAGTMYGALSGRAVPDWFRVACLIALLGFLAFRIARKARRQFAKDMQHRQRLDEDATDGGESQKPMGELHSTVTAVDIPVPPLIPQYPTRELLICAASFLLLLTFNTVRTFWTQCGSIWFYATFGGATLLLILFFVLQHRELKTRWEKVCCGELMPEAIPFKYSWRTTVLFPILSVTAGWAASLLGIGGGLVLSALLLEAQLSPEEASATSGITTFLVATESALQFSIQQLLPVDYGLVMMGAGAASTFIGQGLFMKQIKKRGFRFLIVFALLFVILGSLISLSALGIYNTFELVKHHGSLSFGSICKL